MSQKISLVEVREMKEQIMVLKQLVKDYDNYLHDLMPHIYAYYSKPAQLRQGRADTDKGA